MKIKSLKTQFIGAIAMVLVALIAMGSSTYAWFSMNTAVTAKGMEVKAKTSGGLAIAAYTNSEGTAVAPASTAFASSADAVYLNHAEIYPTSFSGSNWYKAEAENANNYSAKSGTYSTIDAADLGNYRLISKFQVKSMDTNTDGEGNGVDLFVTGISVSGNTNSTVLDQSLRVVVAIGGSYYYFAPLYTEVSGGNLYFYNGTARTAKAVDSAIFINDTTLTAGVKVINAALNTTATDVDVYVYYEGEDENCRSTNAVNIDTLTVQITFSTESGTTT